MPTSRCLLAIAAANTDRNLETATAAADGDGPFFLAGGGATSTFIGALSSQDEAVVEKANISSSAFPPSSLLSSPPLPVIHWKCLLEKEKDSLGLLAMMVRICGRGKQSERGWPGEDNRDWSNRKSSDGNYRAESFDWVKGAWERVEAAGKGRTQQARRPPGSGRQSTAGTTDLLPFVRHGSGSLMLTQEEQSMSNART
ncbi:hypothetical protein GW17_00059476 [Ensete ventricosum]|nr:hypothetical protein GW17_00059476 [Ensete ventricosum]